MEIIKNCPFCGASSSLVLNQNLKGTLYVYVQCNGCNARSRSFRITDSVDEAQNKAVSTWNKRDNTEIKN